MMTKAEVEAMDPDERLELAVMVTTSIMDKIGNDPDIPEAHKKILQQRMKDFLSDPFGKIRWEDVRVELEMRYKHA